MCLSGLGIISVNPLPTPSPPPPESFLIPLYFLRFLPKLNRNPFFFYRNTMRGVEPLVEHFQATYPLAKAVQVK